LSHLSTAAVIGHSITVLNEVDSTNNYAMQVIKLGLAQHGAAYFAQHQTAGKGQRDKIWASNPNENIIISIIANPGPLQLSKSFLLSMATAVACCNWLNEVTNGDVLIKWPNDIYWNDRKAGGILIENSIRASYQATPIWQWAVIGIGINVNQTAFNADAVNAVSIKQITGKEHHPLLLAKQLCQQLQVYFTKCIELKENELLAAYNMLLYKKNSEVHFTDGQATFTAKVIGVNMQGELLLEGAPNAAYPFGTLKWLL